MDTKFFDSLFGGDSANGAKLCMGLTEGDFWARPAGVQLLYQGQDDNIDFDRITAASEINEDVLEISSGQPLTQWLYVVRRVNCSGYEEKTLGAAVRVEFDSFGSLIERSCNKVFIITAKQVDGDRILLKWFYQPIHQAKKIIKFKIYSDNSTGIIDYQNPIGSVNYIGRKFYQFITGELSGDSYKFCIRVAAADNSDDNFTGQIIIQLNRQRPDGISILQSSVI
ncbi:MAG: hypothetical protein NTW93_06930 [Phycisphaerae bacterium]|nr:hypothetical protein [Phycisphaerae bacterium]